MTVNNDKHKENKNPFDVYPVSGTERRTKRGKIFDVRKTNCHLTTTMAELPPWNDKSYGQERLVKESQHCRTRERTWRIRTWPTNLTERIYANNGQGYPNQQKRPPKTTKPQHVPCRPCSRLSPGSMVHDGRAPPSNRNEPTGGRHLHDRPKQCPSSLRSSKGDGRNGTDAEASLPKFDSYPGRPDGKLRENSATTPFLLKPKRPHQTPSVIVNQSGQVIGDPTSNFIMNHLSLRDAGGSQSCAICRQKTLDILDHIQANHVQRPNKDPTKIRRTNQMTDQPRNQIDRSISHETNRPANQPANRPANRPANQPANRPANQPAKRPATDRPTDHQLTDRPPTNRPSGKSANRSTNRIIPLLCCATLPDSD